MSGFYQRVFAREYGESSMRYGESNASDTPAILTPGGAVCTTLFCAGALLERHGSRGGPMYARLADPTAAFELHIDRTEQDAAEVLESMEIPCFATVIGKAFISGSGSARRCAVQVMEIRQADRYTRDAWVLQTADLTIRRIEEIAAALSAGKHDLRIDALVSHYRTDIHQLGSLARMVREALRDLECRRPDTPKENDPAVLVLGIIREHGAKSGITMDEVVRKAAAFGLCHDEVKDAVNVLLRDDECYQPSRGILKPL